MRSRRWPGWLGSWWTSRSRSASWCRMSESVSGRERGSSAALERRPVSRSSRRCVRPGRPGLTAKCQVAGRVDVEQGCALRHVPEARDEARSARCPPIARSPGQAVGIGAECGGQARRPRRPGADSRSCRRRSPRSRWRPRAPGAARRRQPDEAVEGDESGPIRSNGASTGGEVSCGDRREEVASVEGRADDRQPEVRFGQLTCLDGATERIGGRAAAARCPGRRACRLDRRGWRSAGGRCRRRGRRRPGGLPPGGRGASRGGRRHRREPRTSAPCG